MRVSRARLLLLFIGLSVLIFVVLQSHSGERRASASAGESLLDHLRRDRPPATVEVPPGTRLHVRLKERITDRNRAGDVFVGKLDREIRQNGKVLMPEGSRVLGRITRLGADAKRPRSTEVSLVLEQMVVGKKVVTLDSLALTLSTPAPQPSTGPSDLPLPASGFLSQDQSADDPDVTAERETIYEPNTRLTFVLAGQLRLPEFVPAD